MIDEEGMNNNKKGKLLPEKMTNAVIGFQNPEGF